VTDDQLKSHSAVNTEQQRTLTLPKMPKSLLSPVHTSNNVEATSDFVEATFDLVAKTATMSNDFIVKFRHFDRVETN